MQLFFRLFFFIFLLETLLCATIELQKEYLVTQKSIHLSDIIKEPKNDKILFNINSARHTKRIKASLLIKRLHALGYTDIASKHAYIQFTQKSPVDLQQFFQAIKNYYKKHYQNNIAIETITIKPNRYLTQLPKEFTLGFAKRAYLARDGIFFLKDNKRKKIFFRYNIDAKVALYQAKKEIKKGEAISVVNVEKKSIILDKFRAIPLLTLTESRYEAKHRIKKSKTVTRRDIVGLHLVRRGDFITVTLEDQAIAITFRAKALQNGRFGETIKVLQRNNKKIAVIITGKNRAKVK